MNMDTICENKPVDTTFTLFGRTVSLPVFAAPVGAMTLHYGDKYDDLQYNDILVPACAQAGIAALIFLRGVKVSRCIRVSSFSLKSVTSLTFSVNDSSGSGLLSGPSS